MTRCSLFRKFYAQHVHGPLFHLLQGSDVQHTHYYHLITRRFCNSKGPSQQRIHMQDHFGLNKPPGKSVVDAFSKVLLYRC
jgi:hypothetical protein